MKKMKLNWALNVEAQLLLLVQKVKLNQFYLKLLLFQRSHSQQTTKKIENIVEINDISASWDENSGRKTLERINLKIKPGQLYAFIGPVGAGKVLLKI